MGQCSEQITELESLLRLRTFPVAFKHMGSAEALADIPKVRKIMHRTFCQLVTLTRTAGFTIGITAGDIIDPLCMSIIGLRRPGPQTDTMLGRVWFTNQACAVKQSADTPHIPMGGAIVLAPARAEKFTPDVVLVYGTPTQILLLVNGVQYDNYATVDFSCVGETSCCASAIAQAYIKKEAAGRIPCFGERRFGATPEDEIMLAMPYAMLGSAVAGLQGLAKRGIRYPILPYGAEISPFPSLAAAYPDIKEFQSQQD
jgi:uncharacterized protein (DUF169 family)